MKCEKQNNTNNYNTSNKQNNNNKLSTNIDPLHNRFI